MAVAIFAAAIFIANRFANNSKLYLKAANDYLISKTPVKSSMLLL